MELSRQGYCSGLWVAVSFFRGSYWYRDQTRISCLAGGFFITEPHMYSVYTYYIEVVCVYICPFLHPYWSLTLPGGWVGQDKRSWFSFCRHMLFLPAFHDPLWCCLPLIRTNTSPTQSGLPVLYFTLLPPWPAAISYYKLWQSSFLSLVCSPFLFFFFFH